MEYQSFSPGRSGGIVYSLICDVFLASKIAEAAKDHHLEIHNFDRADALLKHVRLRQPVLVILDWDACESDAFKVLMQIRNSAELKGIATVGYLSQRKRMVKEEAERAGCHRVYMKTDFMKSLGDILMRYAA